MFIPEKTPEPMRDRAGVRGHSPEASGLPECPPFSGEGQGGMREGRGGRETPTLLL